jgi:hypothetical protein
MGMDQMQRRGHKHGFLTVIFLCRGLQGPEHRNQVDVIDVKGGTNITDIVTSKGIMMT